MKGKGFYIWQLHEKDDPELIAAKCNAAGLSHVAIKIADWTRAYNVNQNKDGTMVDRVPAMVEALRSYGISPWGWAYVYGISPEAEAEIALKRLTQLQLDGFIVNAESEYKKKPTQAVQYMEVLRKGIAGKIPIALSSYRYPELHQTFPWQEFLSRVDINMPQVYWILAHNPGHQLERSLSEFRLPKYPQVPLFPTGAAFTQSSWLPTVADIKDFMGTAKGLGLDGCNFWLYSQATERFPQLWDAIAEFDWPGEAPDSGDLAEPEEPAPLPEGVLSYAECTAKVRARIRKTPNGAIVGYLERGLVRPVLGVEAGWYRIAEGYVGSTLMKKAAPPADEELTIEERLTRVEGLVDALLEAHQEVPRAT